MVALAVISMSAACGDSEDAATVGEGTATEIGDGATTTTEASSEATTGSEDATSDDTTTSTPATSTTGATEQFTGVDSEEFCQLAESFDIEGALTGVESGAELEAAFDEVLGMLRQLDEAAPAEIEDDVTVVADAWAGLREPLAAADWNLLQVDPAALSGPDRPAQDAASDRLDAYVAQVCGIEPSAGGAEQEGSTGQQG